MEKSRKTFADVINEAMVAANTMDCDKLLFCYKGILYPATFCSPEVFRAMDFLEARSDDIILAGYAKSGTNCLGQILNDLGTIFEKKAQNKESNVNYEEIQEFPCLEMGDTGKYEVGTEYVCKLSKCCASNIEYMLCEIVHFDKNFSTSLYVASGQDEFHLHRHMLSSKWTLQRALKEYILVRYITTAEIH